MLSKCANPKCSQQWHYLHEGKLFHLTPTPEIQALLSDSSDTLYERFWLCDQCSKQLTLLWGGTHVRLVPLPANALQLEAVAANRVVVKGGTRRDGARAVIEG